MNLFIESVIPVEMIKLVAPFVWIIIGHVVEKRFVGRISCFANTLALNLFFYGQEIGRFLSLYVNIGFFVGIFCFLAYAAKLKQNKYFYMALWGYSSVIVGLIMLINI